MSLDLPDGRKPIRATKYRRIAFELADIARRAVDPQARVEWVPVDPAAYSVDEDGIPFVGTMPDDWEPMFRLTAPGIQPIDLAEAAMRKLFDGVA